jgi:hypothetical protein
MSFVYYRKHELIKLCELAQELDLEKITSTNDYELSQVNRSNLKTALTRKYRIDAISCVTSHANCRLNSKAMERIQKWSINHNIRY